MKLKLRLAELLLAATAAMCGTTPSFACSPPDPNSGWSSAKELRETINAADYVFIGQIERVTKRRWGQEDQMGGTKINCYGGVPRVDSFQKPSKGC